MNELEVVEKHEITSSLKSASQIINFLNDRNDITFDENVDLFSIEPVYEIGTKTERVSLYFRGVKSNKIYYIGLMNIGDILHK